MTNARNEIHARTRPRKRLTENSAKVLFYMEPLKLTNHMSGISCTFLSEDRIRKIMTQRYFEIRCSAVCMCVVMCEYVPITRAPDQSFHFLVT